MSCLFVSLFLLAGPIPPGGAWNGVGLGGFTSDGASVEWGVDAFEPSPEAESLALSVVTDAEGSILGVYRVYDDTPPREDLQPDEKAVWNAAGSVDAYAAWKQTRPTLLDPVLVHEPLDGEKTVPGGKAPLVLSVVSDHQRCPTHILVARLGDRTGAVAEDPCRKGEELSKASQEVWVGWAPDGERAAVAWGRNRQPPTGADVDSWGDHARGYLVIVSRRTLASIDLLDAGAGKKLDALADKLAKAKFRVGHRGKAGTPRKKTEIYFAPGFEPEAKELVKLLGLPDSAAQPLTWKTPYSITVAAGS